MREWDKYNWNDRDRHNSMHIHSLKTLNLFILFL